MAGAAGLAYYAHSDHQGSIRAVTDHTAALFDPENGDQGPGAAYNAGAKFYEVYAESSATMPDLRISHVAIDRDHSLANDIGTYFPLKALRTAENNGEIGAVVPRFFGLPTNRSIRTTLEVDCEKLLSYCKEDDVDAAILVPNCPVCHQSVSLAARTLESAGIATVIMGCAKDIVENVGVTRFLFNDFPLGKSAGLPDDAENQWTVMSAALALFEEAIEPRSTFQSPFVWSGMANWKEDYSNPDKLTQEEIARRRAAFDAGKRTAKSLRS